ncbi:VWA domain-containing protein [Niabella sp. CC-SYL272]|uniref:vWA domain-containing protein n=1 Tax=Niabella agricola TaxID=2891571 RepID=UPI001F26C10B|nr:vWA domain-containing protein [Niabella agricola]MCF3108604.1 VWA domain-containing protein [Niabella agricola]
MNLTGRLRGPLLAAVVATALCASCKKDDTVKFTPPLNDNSLPSAAVYKVKVLEAGEKKLRFSVDLAVFKDSKNMEYGFGTGQFRIDTFLGSYAFKPVRAALSGGGTATRYSSIMLMDQSGSTGSTDPDDLRIDAGKIFCRNMGQEHESWVWWFSDDYKAVGTGFKSDTTVLVKDVESVRNLGKGGTNLYGAQYAATDALIKSGTKPTKALLTFTDGEDNRGVKTSAQVEAFAKGNQVRLYNVGLGASSDEYLYDQAVATGGAFMYAKDAQQLISMFGNLGRLLDGSGKFYSVEWEMTPVGSNSIISKGTYDIILKVVTPYNYTIDVPVTVRYQ